VAGADDAVTSAISTGTHNLSAVPIIILALIIIGVVVYLLRKRRSDS
jgi:LPXTG-motif cell wall-anchored protein